jgi:hypothetical protein
MTLVGCKDRTIAAYRTPKEMGAAIVPAGPAEAPLATPAAIRWEATSAWQVQETDGTRAGSYLANGPDGTTADVSVITFAGTGGDDLANVNRWRGQLQQPELTAAELPAHVVRITVPAGSVAVVDVAGTTGEAKTPARLLGAWYRSAERVWFFKMIGAAALVGAERERFIALLKSITPDAAPATPAPTAAPAGPVANPAMTAPQPTGEGPSLVWRAPPDWVVKPAGTMRKGSYAVGAAEVAITVFPGDVGGVLANVNRWRGQAGLAAVDAARLDDVTSTLEANGLRFVITDAAGTGPGTPRILAALVPWQGRTWFFKLSGPADAVAAAKPAFLTFLQSVAAS